MITESVSCPVEAIRTLTGDQLKIYLALKQFVMIGGKKTVEAAKLAKVLGLSTDAVRLELIQLVLKGWLRITLNEAKFFFDDEKLISANWMLLDEQESFLMTTPDAVKLLDSIEQFHSSTETTKLAQLKTNTGMLLANVEACNSVL